MASDIGRAVRDEIARRANYCCEYCLIHVDDAGFPHQVDHILSRKHGGRSVYENIAYACVMCNRYKGSDVAGIDFLTGNAARLFNPRLDRWSDHFRLTGDHIEPLSEIGRVTERVLRLNGLERMLERKLLQALAARV